jgi:predicted transposase YbfD/YdcC
MAYETAYYISSLDPTKVSAKDFNIWIRSHWSIENSLHYVKDVTFKEDASKIITKNAPQNTSLIINIASNIFRKNGYHNIARAIRLVANDIELILKLLLE